MNTNELLYVIALAKEATRFWACWSKQTDSDVLANVLRNRRKPRQQRLCGPSKIPKYVLRERFRAKSTKNGQEKRQG